MLSHIPVAGGQWRRVSSLLANNQERDICQHLQQINQDQCGNTCYRLGKYKTIKEMYASIGNICIRVSLLFGFFFNSGEEEGGGGGLSSLRFFSKSRSLHERK